MNVFISYSHKDESFRQELKKSIVMLERNGVISSWSDRSIAPGQEWEQEIAVQLENSDIILLLISSDFLSSYYCFDKEMKRAIERHDNNEAVVVPIILRPCDWKGSPFSKLHGLPKEAKPISQWKDQDEAWLDVVTKLKETIALAETRSLTPVKQEKIWGESISKEFWEWLNDTEIELKHRRVERVRLDDVYVWPDLKVLNDDLEDISVTINADQILTRDPYSLIIGDEQSGKSTLAKRLFVEIINSGRWPLLIQGEEIKTVEFVALASKVISKQYNEELDITNTEGIVLIIDNYSSIRLNKKYQNKFLETIKGYFEKIILIALDSFQYVPQEIEALDVFARYEILNFGNIKRSELIEKWVSMGAIEEIDEADLYSEADELKVKINSLTRGGILPPKPIFLLYILQMSESVSPQKVELTSYGHCYQYFIYQALEKAQVKSAEVDKYINLLTEFGYAQFNNDGFGLDKTQLDKFFTEYENKYLSLDKNGMMDRLLRCGLLIKRSDRVLFKYTYIYYFFAAKKLAESFANDQSTKKSIQKLLENLHREDCANIIIFITHHSKDDWVLDEIQLCLMDLFDEYPEARLEKESLEFMIDFIKDIPDLVIEHRKVEDERKRHDENLEAIDKDNKARADITKDLDTTDVLAKINRTFKGIEIIGQIIRNRHGSLGKDKLEQLAHQAYGVGLRFLKFFLKISDASKEEVVKLIEHSMKENPSITNEQLEKEARSIFLLLTYGAIYGVLRKVSMSIGSKEAEQIYRKIEEKQPSPAVKLINQAIYLQFNKTMDAKAIQSLANEFNKNPTCERILKEIVIQHIYMFPVKYKQKQQIAEILKLPVKGQLMFERQQNFKM